MPDVLDRTVKRLVLRDIEFDVFAMGKGDGELLLLQRRALGLLAE